MASSSEIFSSVVAGKIQNLASTSSRKREKISDISGTSSSILDEVIRNNYLDSVGTRIVQGESNFLDQGINRVTFQGLDKKGTDADSGYFNMGDKNAGLRALGIDTPETSFYNKESKGRKTQKEHYARLWNVPEDRITDDLIFSMGRRSEEAFDIVASEGQQDGTIVADATYDPTSIKWSNDKRTKATLTNPFTGVDIYGAMNTPEFNTRWFQDSPEQNEIRAKYEAEHGNDYSRFKMPNEGQVVGNTQHGRPAFYLNGEIVSEKSTTLQVDGKWVNIPTIWDGKQYSDDEVAVMLARGDIEPTSVHKSEKEAGIAAKARSQQIDYGQNEKADFFEQDKARRNALYVDAIGADNYWTVFEKSVSSGTDNLQATGYGFAALIADATGNTEFATEMLEHYLSNIDEAQQNGANLPPIEEIDWANPDAALRKLVSLLGEAMPSIVEIGGVALAAYFTGGAAAVGYGSLRYGAGKGAKYTGERYVNKQIGKKALQKIKNRSAAVGGYMAANVMETGGIYGDVAVAGHRDARAITMSLAGGSAAAALEMFYPLKVLKKMGLGNQGTKALYNSFRKNGAGQVFKVIGKEMAAGGLTEGTTEALQFVIEEATQDLIKNGHLPDMTSSQFLWGMANSFVAGLVPGAAISGSVSTASQLSKQIDGDRKFTDEQTAQILQEAVEAGEATADMTEQELIANEKKLDAAIAKIEESEGLNLGDLNVDGMNNLEKAFAYVKSLETTQNEDGTVETPVSTPETEAIKNELITAIKAFNTNDSRVQARKEYATDGIRLGAEVKAINDRFDALEAKFPDRKEKYDAERARLINIKQRKANNRVEPTNVKQRKTARAETKVVRTTIEKSIKKLNAISRKLKDTNLSKKHRKRLEQERNNLGKHINDLQAKTILSKTSSKQIARTLGSFNFQHKSANLEKDVQLQSDVEAFDTLDKNAANAISVLDNEDSSPKEKLDGLNAFFVDYGKALNARDRVIVAIGEATDKVELKNLKIGLADIDAKIAGVEVAYEKTTTYKPAKPSTATSKATDVLYSLLPINDKTLKELKGLKDQLSDTEKELLDAHINLAKTKNTLDNLTDETKNIHQVRDDVLLGTDKQFTGFLSYLRLFEEGKDVISDVNYFIGSLKDKLKVFRKAYNIVKKGGKVWINKETLAIVTTEPAWVKNDEGVLVDNLDEYWWVTNKSSKLIYYINAEIKFGEAVASLINTSEQLAPGRAKQVKEDEALRQSAELLAKQQQKTQPDTGDLENIEIEETKPKPVVKKEIKKGIKANPNKLVEPEAPKVEVKVEKTPKTFIERITAQIAKVRAEVDTYRNGEGKLPKRFKHLAKKKYVQQLLAKIDSLLAKKAKAVKQSEGVANNLMNKFQDNFLKIKDSAFTAFDLFTISKANRESFYSNNPLKSLLDKDGGSTLVEKMLTDLGVTDKAFINQLGSYFLKYRAAFTDELLYGKGFANRDGVGGAFTKETPLNFMYVDIDGVRTLPDDVIFAMMMSSLDWMSINEYNTKVTDERAIAMLLYGEQQHPISNSEFAQFGDMGILWSNAAAELGASILNNLNIKVDAQSVKGLKIQELNENILASVAKDGVILKDPILGKELELALGEMALVVASTVDGIDANFGHDGLIKINHKTYTHPTFVTDKKPDELRKMKTVTFPMLDDKGKKAKDLNNVLEAFKTNKSNTELINGTESRLSEPLSSPSKTVQKYVKNSFTALPEKVTKLLEKLQAVMWEGKQEALTLFDMLDDSNMDELLSIDDIKTKHDERAEGYDNSNKDKYRDVEQVREYIKQGNKPFWLKYIAQKQHRVRIDSNGINGQRSKIHRALFMPASANVTISSEIDRALYQVSIAQAFGYGIDKNDLKGALVEFDRILEMSKPIVDLIQSGNTDKAAFNAELAKFLPELNKADLSASMHVIEGLASLAKYDPVNAFKSAKLGVETDGITNGYAIAQLQFYGVPESILNKGTDAEIVQSLVESFARVGVFVKPGENMEKFISRGDLDIYQSLASFILDTLASPDATTAINERRKKDKIQQSHLDALPAIHGELWDEVKNTIAKFGRNLAKNPLMISGYGAEIFKIIKELSESIVPKMYDDLASLQETYNNAKDKTAALQEAQTYEDNINLFIQVPVVRLMKANKLKSFVPTARQEAKLVRDFKDIYTPAITNALDQFVEPLRKARDAIVKSGEIQYEAFNYEYTKALKVQASKRGITVEKLTTTEKLAIAEGLALDFMPMLYGPWSDSKDMLIQIIKDEKDSVEDSRIEVLYKKQAVKHAIYRGAKFVPVMPAGSRKSSQSTIYARKYIAPSISAYTNTIQNIDSVLIGKVLLDNPEVLAIFDAFMSNVTGALNNSNQYNEVFRDISTNFSVLEKALQRLSEVKGKLSDEAVAAVNENYQENSFEAEQIRKQAANIKDVVKRNEKLAEIDDLGWDAIEEAFQQQIVHVITMQNLLSQEYGNDWLKNATISQMYMSESLNDIAAKTLTIEDVKAGRAPKVVGEVEDTTKNEPDTQTIKVDTKIEIKAESTLLKAKKQYINIRNRLRNKITQVENDSSLKSLASTRTFRTDGDVTGHLIRFNIQAIAKDFDKGMEYLDGKGKGIHESTSKQKEKVLEDVDVEALKQHFLETGGVEAYVEFIFQHEVAHIINKDYVRGYPRKNGKIDLMHPDAIAIEKAANEIAFTKIGFVQKHPEPVIPEFTPEESYKLFEDDEGNDVLTNAGQTNAINKMKEWWKSADKLFVLAGRGGTGKTTIVSKALQELGVDKNRVKFALPTHKAKKVISNATDGYSEDQFTTLASLLGQTKRYDKRTGSFFFARDDEQFASSIRRLQKDQTKLIVIDEVSMVSEQFSDEIVKLSKELDIRVIFMGDNVQLPPIEDTKGKISLSAVFDNVMGFNQKIDLGINTDHYVKLTERMRQGKDSPILGITDILANTIEYIFRNAKTYDGSPKQVGFVLPIVPENGRQDGVHYAEGTIAGGPTDATIDTFVKEYTKDPANVKYIHFNKESKPRTISIRSRIREKLFPEVENAGDLKALPFIKGERIVLGESVATVDGNTAKLSTDLHNGDEVTVIQDLNEARISVEVGGQYKKTYYGVPVKTLQVKTDSGVIYHLVFEDGKLTKRVIHKQMSEGQQKYNMENKVVAEVTTAEVSAAYLINTHKAQGSTYKTVYIDYENIMGNQGSPDWLTKLSSLYVATSRPSERLVLVGTGDLEFGAEGKDLPENTKIAEDLEQGEVVNKDSDTLGSLDNAVDAEAKEIYRTNSLKTTAQNIFNKLNNIWTGYYPNSQEKEAQASHLQRVLDEIILPTGTALDNTTVILKKSEIRAQGEVSLGSENVTVHINKYAPNSYSEQTAQEVYLHELIHILTKSKLAKDEKFKSEVTEIRNAVKAELDKMANPYEIFLHKDADGKVIYLTDKDAEIEAAKQQYNYVFGDTMPDEHYLDEFLAYALTNKHLVKQLSSMSANVVPLWDRESDANVITKIVDLLTEVVTRISNVLNKKSRPANLEMEIFNLTKDMVTVSHERSGTIKHAIRKQQLTKKYDSANEIVSDFLKDAAAKGLKVTSDAYIKGVDKLTKDGKIDNFLANVLYDTKLAALMTSTYGEFVNKHPELQARLDKAFQYFKPNLRHNIAALKADAFGGIDQDFIKLMYKSQKEVDKARVAYKELTEKSLLTAFLDLESLTDNEKDSITRVLLKSDFSVLEASGAYSMEAAIGLLTDGKQLAVEIAKYEDTLDIAGNKHYAVQSSELAKFMMTGKVHNRNQYKNAHMIVKTNPNKRTHQGNKKAEIQDMDVYVTLLALQDASYSPRKDVANVAAREFALDSTHNGITHIIHHHIAFKQESLKTGFNGNPALMTKGYISTITDSDIQIEFAPKDDATQLAMKKKDYIFVDNFEVITGLHDSNYGIYVIKNNPDIPRIKGIASVTSKHHAGTSFKEIIGRNVEAEGQINAVFRKWRKKQTQTQNTLDAHHTMLPIINEEGKIVDYSIHMHHVMMERLLKQKLAFNEVMPTMYSHQQDKVSSEKINKEAMDLLYQHTQLNYAKAPHKFVNILDGKYREEYFDVLPRATRNYILYIAKRDNKKNKQIFNVEQKLLDVVFGYKMPSISNTILFSKSFKAQRYAKVVEKLLFETVALAKVAIVLKIPIVPMVNFTSNFVTSMMYGVPPGYLIKKWREGYKELVKYQEDAHKLQLLELDRLGNPKLRNDPQIDKKIKRLTAKLNKNKVAKFIDAGLFNSITEDINQNDFTYRHKAASKIKSSVIGQKFDGLFKGKVLDVANQAYMGEKTATFKTMMHFTQVSDFIARYAMYSHDTEVKNMNKDKAYKQMVETFVNYDQPLNRYLQYGNDSGLLFFVKYWIRIQRATFNLVKEKPLNVGLLWIANGMLDLDIETIMESSALTGNFFPTEGGIVKVLGEVIIPPGVEILSGEGF